MLIEMVLTAAAAVQPSPTLPVWMVGCWEQQTGDRTTIECWSTSDVSIMRGESVASVGGNILERETMQIIHTETDDPAVPWMIFRAVPAGSAPTEFQWMHSAEPGLTFVNANHDYPQRIRYWRDGRFLMAEISAADGSKARRWRYSPRPPATKRPRSPPRPSGRGR